MRTTILGFVLLLSACGSDSQAPESAQDSVFDTQLRAVDDAKAVGETIKFSGEKRRSREAETQ